MTDAEVWRSIESVPNWYHQIPIRNGIVTPGTNNAAQTLEFLDLPEDAHGLRVLDVGARDGFFSFEMERRGAEVVAVDYVPAEQTGFRVAARLLDSRVGFRNANIYALSPKEYGTFDIVLCLGLLYHLPDPMQALQILRALCVGRLCVESHVIDNAVLMPDGGFQALSTVAPVLSDVPIMQFFPGAALNNDRTNYWGPNLVCLEAMLAECGFGIVSRTLRGDRGILNCTVQDDRLLAYHNKIARGVL